jgi:acetyl-CoA carboxylase biotin carboxyl carrier protein
MPDDRPSEDDVFDLRRLKKLVQMMEQNELHELDLRQGEMRIRIRRGAEGLPQIVTMPAAGSAAASPAAKKAAAPASPPEAVEAADDAKLHVIKSPMVGTFYSSPEPGKPTFVKVGDRVGPETTVCIVEAMKVFNAIPADCSGTIVAVLLDNEQPVEYNQPLFKVDTGKK